ncbi:MAG: SRPBCC family protein [Myxococcota bacterium]|nr:SRPBCC family protein [Myxococcota bacterium]MEC8382373.1 SRPBCC family protein [Myxococcota bacterium]
MAVITTDILIEGLRRDDVFAWLSDFENHKTILEDAFTQVEPTSNNELLLHYNGGFKQRSMTYSFIGPDDSHGGRRIRIKTGGKRTQGTLSYSLRTMKPSTNTLVTLHMDYEPGPMLGALLDQNGIRRALENAYRTALSNILSHIHQA